MTTNMQVQNARTLDRLCSFYRGEMSAVESYTTMLSQRWVPPFAGTLHACQESHLRRARLLEASIRRLGGKVPRGSGPWGVLTQALAGTAAVSGPQPAIAALAEGEDHGLRDYLADMNELPPTIATWVESEILPAQRGTETMLNGLRESLKDEKKSK